MNSMQQIMMTLENFTQRTSMKARVHLAQDKIRKSFLRKT